MRVRYQYGPFGELLRASNANPPVRQSLGGGGFRFSTKYQDHETDLLNYGYWYYNPSTGRWPNRDPIGEIGFRFTTQIRSKSPGADPNDYCFARNDAIGHFDIHGLERKPGGGLHGCCAGHDIQSPKTCDEICKLAQDEAKKRNPDFKDRGGMTVCFGDKLCPCMLPVDAPWLTYHPGDCPPIDALVLEHEKQHLPKTDCNKCGLYEGGPKPGVDETQEECEQRKRTISELQALTGLSDACAKVAQDIIRVSQAYVDAKCKGK